MTGFSALPFSVRLRSYQKHAVPDELLEIAPEIPWKQIRGIGNVLRHEYHKIADDVIWVVVSENIAPLKAAILKIQKSL